MRQFKNIEILKIGMRDLVHEEDVESVTRRLSALAEAELEAALDVARDRLAERRGVAADDLPAGGLAVLGLGKLGGAELNYSSDIDILFVYEAGAKAPGAGLSRQEFYEAMARLVVEAMTRPMVHGHVFRVDVRLRPDGHMGELVCSDAACLKYYGERSAPWERQALIKARCVAGDAAFGGCLVADLQTLAYDRRLAANAASEVRQMKDRIEAELGRRAPSQRNVKLGQGGIRDIEFIVQLLQLQHGWRDPYLRIPQTLGALRRLRQEEIVAARDAELLGSAYVFLRTIEHRLQMMHSLQIHSLPRGEGELQKLAIRMGFEGREAFLEAYERHTRATREIFERFVPR
jgi:glutamate-ammonia-ligase adenylyltransferase